MKASRAMLRVLMLSAVAGLVVVALAQNAPPPPHDGPHGGPGRGDGFGPPPPHGGPGDGKWGGPGSEFFAEVMMARLSRELELSEEQTVLMVRRFTELRDQTRELRRKRLVQVRELDELLRKKEPKPERATALLAEITQIDEQVYRERQRVLEVMSAELDEIKRARLYLFLDRFEMDMRRMIGEARERHKGRPAGGRPDGPPPHRIEGDGPGRDHDERPGGPPRDAPHLPEPVEP